MDTDTLYIAEGGNWIPVSGGAVSIVANVAALGALNNPQDGDLAYQVDTRQFLIRQNNQWTSIGGGVELAATAIVRNAMTRADGALVYQQDTETLFVRANNAWHEVGGGGVVEVVADQATRWAMPVAQVSPGLLAYQQDTGSLWQYTGPAGVTPGSIATPANWTQITSTALTPKVIEVQDATGLPAPAAARADLSQPLYLVRFDALGQPLNQLLWFDDTTPASTPGNPNPVPAGEWIIPTSTTYLKALRGTPDQTGTVKVGDIQGTIEPDHAQLKMFDGQNWQLLFDEDEIRSWIAAGSLFQGTVMPQPVAGGAIDLVDLPVPGSQWKGYYWTWTGPSNWQITDGTGAQDPAQDPAFVPIVVTPSTAFPVAAGQPVTITLDTGGAAIGVARQVSAVITTTGGPSPGSKHVNANGLAADTDADIATKLEAAWNDGDLDLDVTVVGAVLTLTPRDPATVIQSVVDHPAGATPRNRLGGHQASVCANRPRRQDAEVG